MSRPATNFAEAILGEIQREIGDVSQKMLTQTLRRLERDGLAERQAYPVVPPKVEYSLTPLGRTLIEPLRDICKWADQYLHQLEAARASDDDGRASQREVASGSGLQIPTLVSNPRSARQQFARCEPPEEREGPPGEAPREPINTKDCEWLWRGGTVRTS